MLRLGSVFVDVNHDGKYMKVHVFFLAWKHHGLPKDQDWDFYLAWGVWSVEVLFGAEKYLLFSQVLFVLAKCNLSSGIFSLWNIFCQTVGMMDALLREEQRRMPPKQLTCFFVVRFCIHFGLLMLFFLFLIFCCKGDSKLERFNDVSSIVLFNQFLEAPRGRSFVGAFLLEPTNMNPWTFQNPPRKVVVGVSTRFSEADKNPWAPQTLVVFVLSFFATSGYSLPLRWSQLTTSQCWKWLCASATAGCRGLEDPSGKCEQGAEWEEWWQGRCFWTWLYR